MSPRFAPCFAALPLIACAASVRPPVSQAPVRDVAAAAVPVVAEPPSAVPSEAPVDATAALKRLFSSSSASPTWFAPSFLAAVPLGQIDAIVGQIRAASGAFREARVNGDAYVASFEKGRWEGSVIIDAQGRFTGLTVRPGAPESTTVDEALGAFRALPGQVSVVIRTNGVDVGAMAPSLPLAVGSTFKLAIVAALRAEVERKKRSWKDVVTLASGDRSLGSEGGLQDWPERSPLTLHTVAGLMISTSDNTATDVLLRIVGRRGVEAFGPRNKPFLSTREMFQLKSAGGTELTRFRQGDEGARRTMLDELRARPLPDPASFPTAPTALDIEWFFTTSELCDLMKKVHDLPVMGINPGLAKKSDWDHVAYKGGSEPGVLNMTTWVEKGSQSHCVSATWNADTALDQLAFTRAYTQALAALKK